MLLGKMIALAKLLKVPICWTPKHHLPIGSLKEHLVLLGSTVSLAVLIITAAAADRVTTLLHMLTVGESAQLVVNNVLDAIFMIPVALARRGH